MRLRLSELALCPRACACRGLNHEPAPVTERTQRLFDRGHLDEQWIFNRYKAKYAPKRVYRQVNVPWPLGTGHVDIVVPSARLLTEVKSTSAIDGMYDQAVRQARMYLRYYKRGYKAAVHFLDVRTMDETVIPIVLRPQDVEHIDQEVGAVQLALSGGTLPPCRLGDTPNTCRCQFKASAWEDYEPPEYAPLHLPGWAKERFERAYQNRQTAKNTLEIADEEYDKAKAVLVELGLEPDKDYRLPSGLIVRRTQVAGRETFSLSRARKAGAWLPVDEERFAPFMKLGEPTERFTVKEHRVTIADELAEKKPAAVAVPAHDPYDIPYMPDA